MFALRQLTQIKTASASPPSALRRLCGDKTAASRWKTELAKRSIGSIVRQLAKSKNYSGLGTSALRRSAARNPAATKNALMEFIRGTGRSAGPTSIGDAWFRSREGAAKRLAGSAVSRLQSTGRPVSPLSLPDDAKKSLWHGWVPPKQKSLVNMFDSAGRFARRDDLGNVENIPVWWAAAPEIATGFGDGGKGGTGYVMRQIPKALRSFRLRGRPITEAITGHDPRITPLFGPSKTPRNLQFEAVAFNDETVPQNIYRVLSNARPDGPVKLAPGSRSRRKNPAKFDREMGGPTPNLPRGPAVHFGLNSPHMLQEMKFVSPQQAKADYVKSLGNLEW